MSKTTTDWRTLPPGRELDAIVAEMMGWGWMTHDRPEVLPRKRWLAPPEEVGDFGHVRPADMSEPMEEPWWLSIDEQYIDPNEWRVPRYSSNDAAALPLLDKHSSGVRIARDSRDHTWVVTLEMNDVVPDVAGEGDGIAEAICYAMLARQEALTALDSETRGEG